ncbi:TolC family protein [Flavobacterium sp. Fl-318]|uniref:TolC family protein n=1 Tax=Flavobacterium cupriresistens TaxID=2893885 RepID=A0ABU4RK43_9FLAO|nr:MULTISPECIES: TolC family protein [unclassified Flavobacterium]MDX6191860.1 TolC family protein [Flavobacterium sp. Fl-318]UFH41802.1 TolC family protein [Flavobacterium sp. F-323]
MNKRIALTILFLTFSAFVSGQDISWTLTKCMEVALQNNIDIKIRQLEVKRVEKLQNSVLNRMLPGITLHGEEVYNFGSTIDPSTNGRVSSNIQQDNFYLNARSNLIDFSHFTNAKKDKINIELARVEKEVLENEYKLQLLESYYQALYTQELLKIQNEELVQSLFNLNRVTKEVAIGNKPQSDLYDMQLSYSEDENRNLQTEQLYLIKKKELFQLMNVFDFDVDKINLETSREENSLNISEEKYNPKIKFSLLNYQNSMKSINLEKASKLPVLSAYYGYSTFFYKNINQTTSNDFFVQLSDNKNQEVGMQLAIPIFNGFRSNKRISAAKIESEKAKLAMERAKQELDKELDLEEQKKTNYLKLQQKLNEKQMFAEASFGTTQAKFTNGKIEAILYATVKNQFLVTKYEVLKNDLQLQYIDLKINLLKNNSL